MKYGDGGGHLADPVHQSMCCGIFLL